MNYNKRRVSNSCQYEVSTYCYVCYSQQVCSLGQSLKPLSLNGLLWVSPDEKNFPRCEKKQVSALLVKRNLRPKFFPTLLCDSVAFVKRCQAGLRHHVPEGT